MPIKSFIIRSFHTHRSLDFNFFGGKDVIKRFIAIILWVIFPGLENVHKPNFLRASLFHVSFLLLQVEKTGETPEKEQIELKEGEEKKDDSTEKGKKKKEKKVKEPKEKGPNCIDLISKDLDLGNRDSNNVNVEIDVSQILATVLKRGWE